MLYAVIFDITFRYETFKCRQAVCMMLSLNLKKSYKALTIVLVLVAGPVLGVYCLEEFDGVYILSYAVGNVFGVAHGKYDG